MNRIILHCDMDNCYASIERSLNPKLKDVPIAVCGSIENRHGIVLAKSQEAKIRGVKTGEVIWQAKIKCPDLVIVPPHYDEYLKYSRWAKSIYYEYTSQVESFGLDECWLDISGSTNLFGSGVNIANTIRKRMKKELGITVSIGVSFNKIFAKLGSDMNKPDGITVITRNNFRNIVWPLKTDELMGIGSATKRKLRNYGIENLGDLAKYNPDVLKKNLGIVGLQLWNYANGRDDSRVEDRYYKAPMKTIGNGITCREDLLNSRDVRNVLHELSLNVSRRMRDSEVSAKGIQLSIRDNTLFTVQYQCPLPYTTANCRIIIETAMELFEKNYKWKYPIRSVTIRAINLVNENLPVQTDMFRDYRKVQRDESLDKTVYKIRKRFGNNSLTFANLMGDIKMPKDRTDICTLPGSYAI